MVHSNKCPRRFFGDGSQAFPEIRSTPPSTISKRARGHDPSTEETDAPPSLIRDLQ